MISSTTASNSRGNLRGSSSSSAAAIPEEDKPDDIKVSSSKSKSNIRGYVRGSSSSSAAAEILEEDEDAFNDTPPPVGQIIDNIELHELDKLAYKRLKHLSIDIKFGLKQDEYATTNSDIYLYKMNTQRFNIYLH